MPKPISFSKQREAFANNLRAILNKLDYSVTTFSLKLNSLLGERSSTLVSTTDVNSWINNEKLPNLYLLTKISSMLNTPIDSLLSPAFNLEMFKGRSFASGVSATVSSSKTTKVINTNSSKTTKDTNTMSNSATVIKVSKTRLNTLRQMASERTTSSTVNYLMLEKITNYGMLKTLAEKTGISTRTLRDSLYYGHSMSLTNTSALTTELKTSPRGLGLFLDKQQNRYVNAHFTAKA